MSNTVFIGFNTTVENDVALRMIAAERRVDKTVVLNEAIVAYLSVRARASIEQIVNGLALADITCQEAIDSLGALMVISCQEQRAHSEAEWSGHNDAD